MQTFRAMNTDVTLRVPGLGLGDEAVLATAAAEHFADAERLYSRFDAVSELSSLNRATTPFVATRALFDALVDARAYVELTDGRFDPCIGGSLVALGYDRSFVPDRASPASSYRPARVASFLDVVLDAETCTVTRPEGVAIDLGGMAKGRTVDRVAATLPIPSVVDAGGDGVMRGEGLEGEGYLLDVEDPRDPARVLLSVHVADRAFATSAPNRRRWRVGDETRHHLVDPRTGASGLSDLAQVTVVASSAERADVLAKTLYLLGEREAARFVSRHADVAAVLVRHDGTTRLFGDLEVDDA